MLEAVLYERMKEDKPEEKKPALEGEVLKASVETIIK